MPGPGWLTQWVKMNAKHVAYNNESNSSQRKDPAAKSLVTETTASMEYDHHSAQEPNNKLSTTSASRQRRRLFSRQQAGREATNSRGSIEERSDRDHESAGISSQPGTTRGHPSSVHRTESQNRESSKISSSRAPASQDMPPTGMQPGINLGGFNILSHPFFGGEEGCSNCVELDAKLVSALDDLEYMRDVALKAETMTKEESWAGRAGVQEGKASKLLQEAVTRHQKQVEQLMKERVRISSRCANGIIVVMVIQHRLTFYVSTLHSNNGNMKFMASWISLPA